MKQVQQQDKNNDRMILTDEEEDKLFRCLLAATMYMGAQRGEPEYVKKLQRSRERQQAKKARKHRLG